MMFRLSQPKEEPKEESTIIDKQTPNKDSQTATKLNLIKPKNRGQPLEEWQNDDNLTNIVHEMIDDVKGNLGYIKLSKLTHLNKKLIQMKDSNRKLNHANEHLLHVERFLTKKVKIAEETIQNT